MPRLDVSRVANIIFPFLWKQKYKTTQNKFFDGIDVGLTHFAILSDKTVYENPKFFRTLEKKLAKAQRILSRRKEQAIRQKKPLSEAKNYQKQRIKVACIHEKIANKNRLLAKSLHRNHQKPRCHRN